MALRNEVCKKATAGSAAILWTAHKAKVCTEQNMPPMPRCPPGHGDIYPALLGTGMLNRLREKGINYVFVSNSDNLGATLDLDILAYFAQSGNGFLMEVCHKRRKQHATYWIRSRPRNSGGHQLFERSHLRKVAVTACAPASRF